MPPALLLGSAGVWTYAFNTAEPQGIKLLGPTAGSRLRELLGANSAAPDVGALENDSDRALFEHGLITYNGKYRARARMAVAADSLNVWLHITNGCNLGCYYCYIPQLEKHVDGAAAAPAHLTMDADTVAVIANRFDEYCAARHLRHLHVKFAGGEPTLAITHIDGLCRALAARDARYRTSFSILTNGTFDADHVIPVFQRHSFNVSISIDGLQRRHDATRFSRAGGRRTGTWDTIMRNVDRLLSAGIRPYFLYTITKKNLEDVRELARFIAQHGCGFRLSLERSDRQVGQHHQRAIAAYLTDFYREFASEAPLDMRFDRDARFAEWSLDKKKHIACNSCRGYIAVAQNGQVASCQMRLNEPFGDLRSENLASIVQRFAHDSRTVFLTAPHEKRGACTRCEYRFVCAGGCPQHTRDAYKRFDHPSPWCYVYGTLLPVYIEANAIHLARRTQDCTRH